VNSAINPINPYNFSAESEESCVGAADPLIGKTWSNFFASLTWLAFSMTS